jgi:predicted HicB family RNase H-like nuclease
MEANYKGFVSKIFFSSEASGFYGEVMNIDDHIAFQAETTTSIITAMQDAIDRYLNHTQLK